MRNCRENHEIFKYFQNQWFRFGLEIIWRDLIACILKIYSFTYYSLRSSKGYTKLTLFSTMATFFCNWPRLNIKMYIFEFLTLTFTTSYTLDLTVNMTWTKYALKQIWGMPSKMCNKKKISEELTSSKLNASFFLQWLQVTSR